MHSEHKNEEHNHTTATRMGNRKRLTLVLSRLQKVLSQIIG
jgi:hypothetical protein